MRPAQKRYMEGGGNMVVKENVLAALLAAQGAPVSGQQLADGLGAVSYTHLARAGTRASAQE